MIKGTIDRHYNGVWERNEIMDQPARINPRKLHGLFNILGITLIFVVLLSFGLEYAYPYLYQHFESYLIGYDRVFIQTVYEIASKIIAFFIPFFCCRKFLEVTGRDLYRRTYLSPFLQLTFASQAISIYLFFTFVVNGIIFTIYPESMHNAQLHPAIQGSNPGLSVLYLFYFIVVIPFLEEYAFRGVILRCTSWVGGPFGLVVSAILYMSFYIGQSSMLVTLMLGGYLSLIAMMHRSIWPSFVAHVAVNLMIVLSIFLPAQFGWIFGLIAALAYGISVYSLMKYRKNRLVLKQELKMNRIWRYFITSWVMLLAIIILILRAVYYIIM